MIPAAKCTVDSTILRSIELAGLEAVELYTTVALLKNRAECTKICQDFPFTYAVHAPTNGHEPELLAEFVNAIKAKIVVFHDIYWLDEWETITKIFQSVDTKVCVENVSSTIEPLKIMRRFGAGYCLDLEHMEMQICGVANEILVHFLKEISHIHMTGYTFGTQSWHTPFHHAPIHSANLLDLMKVAGYNGMIVSEASIPYQTLEEFKKLKDFFDQWAEK